MANLNPLDIKIINVEIQKFNGNDKMSIQAQFVELSLFQSMFEPTIKAEMLVNDQIGLFVNYPFTGEELVIITYEQINSVSGIAAREANSPTQTFTLKFIIKGVRNVIVGDRARSLMYIVDLVTPYYLQNVRKYVSHAYNDLLEDAAEKVYNEYIAQDTQDKFQISKPFVKEVSTKVRHMVVPNLRPLAAIKWLAKHTVASDYDNHFVYLFYEDLDNFNYLTIQKLVEDAYKVKEQIRRKKYKYVSDTEIESASPSGDPDQDTRLIMNIVYNRRFSTIEKIAGGYYQNELVEISMLQKSYNSTPSELDNANPDKFMLGNHPLNTPEYINYVKNQKDKTEYSNRIRYIINNYEDFGPGNLSQPSYRSKFGKTTRYLFALNQIDLTITIPANMSIKAGDIIWCDLPENHGFNIVDQDIYLSGFFIVSEVKQVLTSGERAATSLRIYKDGYLSTLLESSEYNTSVSSPVIRNYGHQ